MDHFKANYGRWKSRSEKNVFFLVFSFFPSESRHKFHLWEFRAPLWLESRSKVGDQRCHDVMIKSFMVPIVPFIRKEFFFTLSWIAIPPAFIIQLDKNILNEMLNRNSFLFLSSNSGPVRARQLLQHTDATTKIQHDTARGHREVRERANQNAAGRALTHPEENIHEVDEFVSGQGWSKFSFPLCPLRRQLMMRCERWLPAVVNDSLSTIQAKMEVEDLFVDLADGVKLLKLLEIISGEKLGKPNNGRMRVHKIENLNKSLAFLHTKVSKKEFFCRGLSMEFCEIKAR